MLLDLHEVTLLECSLKLIFAWNQVDLPNRSVSLLKAIRRSVCQGDAYACGAGGNPRLTVTPI